MGMGKMKIPIPNTHSFFFLTQIVITIFEVNSLKIFMSYEEDVIIINGTFFGTSNGTFGHQFGHNGTSMLQIFWNENGKWEWV